MAEAKRAASATDFCMDVDCAMFSAISLSVCSPVLRISSTCALMLPKVLIAALTANAVMITNTQVGQKISDHVGQVRAFSLLSLACGFLVGWPSGVLPGEAGSAAGFGILLGGFTSLLLCSCSFFAGDGAV